MFLDILWKIISGEKKQKYKKHVTIFYFFSRLLSLAFGERCESVYDCVLICRSGGKILCIFGHCMCYNGKLNFSFLIPFYLKYVTWYYKFLATTPLLSLPLCLCSLILQFENKKLPQTEKRKQNPETVIISNKTNSTVLEVNIKRIFLKFFR